jgi:2-hydroxychromene-2-carboxylate isomerase
VQQIRFHLDFISPYACLAFERMPEALEGVSYGVRYQPVLLGALLKHYGHQGPPAIPPKRVWTYRHALWLGHAHGVPIQMPDMHPFNPLPLLRLALACAEDDGCINRHVAGTLLRHVWKGGGDPNAAERLQALQDSLTLRRDPAGPEVKAMLRANTDAAIADGVFGAPSFSVGGRLFWGFDALPMLREFLLGNAWFEGPAWSAAEACANVPLSG